MVSCSEEKFSEQLDKILVKFENFEIRLESIEAKLEKVEGKEKDGEIKNLLVNIIEKVSQQNGNEKGKNKTNEIVLNKIDRLETQMVLFETKIQKIVDFIEEE